MKILRHPEQNQFILFNEETNLVARIGGFVFYDSLEEMLDAIDTFYEISYEGHVKDFEYLRDFVEFSPVWKSRKELKDFYPEYFI